MLRSIAILIISSVAFLLVGAMSVHAQVSEFTVAQTLDITDAAAKGGDVMCLDGPKQALTRCVRASDQTMYGILVEKPVAVYRTRDKIPVAREGIVVINVTTLSGSIRAGDYLTGSPIAGKGQKSPELTGYMVGVALESFDGKNGTAVQYDKKQYMGGQIKAVIGIGPSSPILTKAAGGFFGRLQQLAGSFIFNVRSEKTTDKLIRYILALLLITVVTWVNFRSFGNNVTKGIEAIGRNPLSKVSIQSMIVINTVVLVIVEVAAVALCFLIITA